MPPEVKKNRVVRVSETTWRAAQKVADQRGEVLSEIVRDALVCYVATADADVDLEPGWAPWPGFTEPHLVTMLRGEPGGVVWHHPRQAHYGHLGVPATNLVAEYDAAIAMAEQRGADKARRELEEQQ